jgi:hypothetical protein
MELLQNYSTRYDFVPAPKGSPLSLFLFLFSSSLEQNEIVGDPLFENLQNVLTRARSLVLWRSELPHCNYPNYSNRFRMTQYLKCFPAQYGAKGTDVRAEMIKDLLPKDFVLTELGKKVLGLEPWNAK